MNGFTVVVHRASAGSGAGVGDEFGGHVQRIALATSFDQVENRARQFLGQFSKRIAFGVKTWHVGRFDHPDASFGITAAFTTITLGVACSLEAADRLGAADSTTATIKRPPPLSARDSRPEPVIAATYRFRFGSPGWQPSLAIRYEILYKTGC